MNYYFSLSKPGLLILVLLSMTVTVAQDRPAREELSQELEELVSKKWETIKSDSKNRKDEWSGTYWSADGPTVTTRFAWAPASGFIAYWYNCSKPWTARVNYGSAIFEADSLRITPELADNASGSFSIALEFIPVRWGEQRFLIPSDQMMRFAYAVNSQSITEIESFFMKVDDYQKKRSGLPALPAEYASYLRMKPITPTVSGFGPKPERWYPKIILNTGKAHGVIPGMKFFFSRRGTYMVVEVTSVEERTSEAWVVLTSRTPRVGWRLSSRAPQDLQRYLP